MQELYRRSVPLSGEPVSGFGKSVRRVDHAKVALEEARHWAEELQKAEFRGLGDTREAARFRVASKTGVAESYLKRLRYKWREMGEVAGSQYRALMLAYEELVSANEAAAGAYRAERHQLENQRHAAGVERAREGVGAGSARD
jgi:hypothetical protein